MKLGDYFKKYNIGFLGSSPKKIKTKIDGIDLEKIFEKTTSWKYPQYINRNGLKKLTI